MKPKFIVLSLTSPWASPLTVLFWNKSFTSQHLTSQVNAPNAGHCLPSQSPALCSLDFRAVVLSQSGAMEKSSDTRWRRRINSMCLSCLAPGRSALMLVWGSKHFIPWQPEKKWKIVFFYISKEYRKERKSKRKKKPRLVDCTGLGAKGDLSLNTGKCPLSIDNFWKGNSTTFSETLT